MGKVTKEQIKKSFEQFDYNNNNLLSLAELDKAIIELLPQFASHKPAIMRAYKAADHSQDGFITEDEFEKFVDLLWHYDDLFNKFDQLDKDDDRRISFEEFKKGQKLVGLNLSEEKAREEFDKIDTNKGGMVLFEEKMPKRSLTEDVDAKGNDGEGGLQKRLRLDKGKGPALESAEDVAEPMAIDPVTTELTTTDSTTADPIFEFSETPIAVYTERIKVRRDDGSELCINSTDSTSGRREEVVVSIEPVSVLSSPRWLQVSLKMAAPKDRWLNHHTQSYWSLHKLGWNSRVAPKYPLLEEDYVFRYRSDNALAAPLHLLFPEVFPEAREELDYSSVRYVLAMEDAGGNLCARLEIYAQDAVPPNLHLHIPARRYQYLLPDRSEPLQCHSGDYIIPGVEDAPTNQQDMSFCAIPTTTECTPSAQPREGFHLELYDYQLRSLGWMKDIEEGKEEYFYAPNVTKVGKTLVDLRRQIFHETLDPTLLSQNLRAGIIADKPGVGKTITALALIHDRPFPLPESEYLHKMKSPDHIYSKATVIFAPNNLCAQWESEIDKCLDGQNLKVICLKGKASYATMDFSACLTADIIIMSYQFLTNGAYRGTKPSSRSLDNFQRHWDFSTPEGIEKFVTSKKGSFALTWCHFHRIIFDEFHEIGDKMASIRDQIRMMSADYFWGLTGTPRLQNSSAVEFFATVLNVETEDWVHSAIESARFVTNRVRRNEPDPKFPDPVLEQHWVRQTVTEQVVYRRMQEDDERVRRLYAEG
ncbi:hypothetical protein HK097_004588, partial [Rhizophlyctis rosea]